MTRPRVSAKKVIFAERLQKRWRTADFRALIFAFGAVLGVNGAFVFGFTLKMELGSKSLIDGSFILSLSYPFFVFAVGTLIYIKIIGAAYDLSKRAPLTTPTYFGKLPAKSMRRVKTSAMAIFAFSIFWIIAFPLIDAAAFLHMSALFITFFIYIFAILRYDPVSGKRCKNHSPSEVFQNYFKKSISWKSYLSFPSLATFNAVVALIISSSIGTARFYSLLASSDHCVVTKRNLIKGSVFAQSSDYLFIGSSDDNISNLSPFKRHSATLVRKDEVVYIGFGHCDF